MTTRPPAALNAVLISTYDMGRQPFGIASAATCLKEAGAQVTCLDLSIQSLPRGPIANAALIAFHLPMHTATRIATTVLKRVRKISPKPIHPIRGRSLIRAWMCCNGRCCNGLRKVTLTAKRGAQYLSTCGMQRTRQPVSLYGKHMRRHSISPQYRHPGSASPGTVERSLPRGRLLLLCRGTTNATYHRR
jgi:hypothetical protein